MNDYLVSARKYRPQKFDDVIGQTHITETLNNAIINNKIAHAYLFCGPRGVGKTTCARIFAQLVNKESNSEYNIFELDGASNNLTEDIKKLIDQVKIPPQIGKYKIYIIDEVHMLTKHAFNAFLKTLEEPPKHCIFILATTEKDKIIPTILSRCQIFDFNKIHNHDVTSYLSKLAKKEQINVKENTLNLIAEQSDGSLRDALSIFDRVHTFSDKEWDFEKISKILLALDSSFGVKFIHDLIRKDIPKCLLKIDEIIKKGYEPKEIVKLLTTQFRNIMIAKNESTLSLISEKESTLNAIINLSKEITNEQILLALSCLNECDKNYQNSINQRFLVELCIMQLCSLSELDLKKKLLIEKPVNAKKELKISYPKDESRKTNTNLNNQESNIEEKPKTSINHNIQLDKKEPNSLPKKGIITKNINSNLISISEELKSLEKVKVKKSEEKREKEWDQKKLLINWQRFSKKLEDQKKINLHTMFERYIPVIEKNNLILTVVSLSEKAELEIIKSDLLSFLKKELENDFIKLKIDVKNVNNKNMLHTKEEKYNYIIEQNKNIELLIDKLSLSIT